MTFTAAERALAARVLADAGYAELAAKLAPKRGRPCAPHGPSGETINAEALADLWCEIRDRMGELASPSGLANSHVLASFESDPRIGRTGNPEEFLDRLRRLEGFPNVRKVLRFRGES